MDLLAGNARNAPQALDDRPPRIFTLRRRRTASPFAIGPLERRDVQLPHLEHRFHRSLGVSVLGVAEHLSQGGGDDLPRHPPPVRQPPARPRLSALRELLPEPVDLPLRPAHHHEGHAHRERERRATPEIPKLPPANGEHLRLQPHLQNYPVPYVHPWLAGRFSIPLWHLHRQGSRQ